MSGTLLGTDLLVEELDCEPEPLDKPEPLNDSESVNGRESPGVRSQCAKPDNNKNRTTPAMISIRRCLALAVWAELSLDVRYWIPTMPMPIVPTMPTKPDAISRTNRRMCLMESSPSLQLMIDVSMPLQSA